MFWGRDEVPSRLFLAGGAEKPIPGELIARIRGHFDPEILDFGRIEARLRGECAP